MVKYFEEIVYQGKPNRLKESFIKKNHIDLYNEVQKYNGRTFLEKLFIFYKGEYRCKCGSHTKFVSFSKGYLKFCSYNCSSNDIDVRKKYKATCEIRYGVSNILKSDMIKDKKKLTCLEKYGATTYLQTDNVRNIMIEKYGVDNPFKSSSFQKVIKKTNLEKYGFENSLSNQDVRNKSIKTNLEKYEVNHYSKSEFFKFDLKLRNFDLYKTSFDFVDYELLNKIGNLNTVKHNKCGNVFEIQSQLIRRKKTTNSEMCTVCNPYTPSYKEVEMCDFIGHLGIEIIKKYRDKYEIDVYIPDLKIGFEYNGLYWHSELYKDKNYHIDKTNYFKDKGIQLIHIWEDDWKYKKDIVQSIILNKLKKTSNKIGSRKCEIVEISDKYAKVFLNENHLQGWCVSKYRIALKLDGEIVSLCTFGKNRINLGASPTDGNYELLRFCNKINWSVSGSFSKILNFFKKKFNPIQLVTYSDISISDGGLYLKSGFKYINSTLPNYHYIIDGVRKNRFLFNKQNLINDGYSKYKTEREIMFENKHYRIHDCGSMKFALY